MSRLALAPFFSTSRDTEDVLAFVGEAAITGRYWVFDWLALEGGYQVLLVDGVTLAGEQAATTTIALPAVLSVADNNHGDMILHGFRAGLTAIW